MELKKMNAIELLKKAEITKEDFKHEVVFKTLFNLINEMIYEEDKLENEYHKLKQSRDTWEDIAQNLRKDLELKVNQILRLKNLVDAYNDEAINLFDQSHVLVGNNKAETLIKAGTMAKMINELNLVFESDNNDFKTYKKQRNLLNEKISNLLIAIEKGYITVFPENDLTPDYIQDLEDAQKQIIKESVFNRV